MLKSKRIVFFCGTLMEGGAERVISILTRHMAEQGYSIQILLFYDRVIHYDVDPRIKITVVEKECESKNILGRLMWIRSFIKDKADVFVSFLAPFNILALVAHFGLKSKIIVADRNDPRHIPGNFFIRKLRDLLYRFADKVVVQTSHNKAYFSRVVQKKSVIIPNPVDMGEKAGLALRTEKKHEIVSVGRLMPQKNQIMLLEAFASLKDEFPEYTLTIYGEGPERERLENRARELGIQDRFFLPGNVKDVFDRIACSELFVLSSNYEGMPNALIEAMCLGLPCISTKVSGATDLISNRENGCLISVNDGNSLKENMHDILSDKSWANNISQRAVNILKKINTHEVIKNWADLID